MGPHDDSFDVAAVSFSCAPLPKQAYRLVLGIPPIDPVEAKTRYTPERILRHGPATIVFWKDGTKTVVKPAPDEEDSPYNAFASALAIKIFGSNSKVKKVVKNKTEEQK